MILLDTWCETIRQSTVAHQRTTETRSDGAEWYPEVRVYPHASFQPLREQLSHSTPGNEELIALGRTQRPPQSWFDEQDDPFSSD